MQQPTLIESNPGSGFELEIGFEDEKGNQLVENLDLVDLMRRLLNEYGHDVESHDSYLVHTNSSYVISPQFVDAQVSDEGVQIVSTVQVNHPLYIPEGVFEYQHDFGSSPLEAFENGFVSWIETDFATLLEVQSSEPNECQYLVFREPSADKPGRRAVLGPLMQISDYDEDQIEALQQQHSADQDDEDGHGDSFCPCCFLTESMEVFKPFIESDGFVGIRMFATNADGDVDADCRVNGNEFPEGAKALAAYAHTWTSDGFEARKQYVILHNFQ